MNNQSEDKAFAATSAHKSVGGLGRIRQAIRYSYRGLISAIRYEAAFRQELLVVIPALIGVWFVPVTTLEKLLLVAVSINVLTAELLNSAVEMAVDRISIEHHPLSGRAKDLGSAAVFLAITLMLLCWALIVGPVLWQALRG